jgi:hypothetical protein
VISGREESTESETTGRTILLEEYSQYTAILRHSEIPGHRRAAGSPYSHCLQAGQASRRAHPAWHFRRRHGRCQRRGDTHNAASRAALSISTARQGALPAQSSTRTSQDSTVSPPN